MLSLKLKFPSVDRSVLHDLCVLSTLGPALEIDLLMQTKINLMKKNIYYVTSTSGMTSHPLYHVLHPLYLCHHNLSTDITPTFE